MVVLTLFAYVLDYAIRLGAGIPTLGDPPYNIYSLPAIGAVWTALRDVANLGFLFILVYIAVRTILGLDSQGQKQVVMVIIIALFINFSAFFTKIVIDAGNSVTTIAYNQISFEAGARDGGGIANAFMSKLGLQTFLKETSLLSKSVSQADQLWAYAGMAFFGIVYGLTLAYVFAVGASIFLVRTVKLIIYIILSPLAFISKATPGLSGNFDSWLKGLLEQAVVGPMYIVLVLICAKITEGLALGHNSPLGGAFSSLLEGKLSAGFVSIVVISGMIIYFLLWSAKTSLDMAGSFAGFAPSIVKGAGLLMAGAAGRGTVGWAGAKLGALYDRTAARLKGSSVVQGLQGLSEKASAVYNKPGVKWTSRIVRGVAAGVTFGASEVALGAAKGTAKATAAGVRGVGESLRDVLRKAEEEKFGTKYSYKSREEEDKKRASFLKDKKEEIDREKAVREGGAEFKKAVEEKDTAAEKVAREKVEQAVSKMVDKELEALNISILTNEAVIRALSPRQVEFLTKSEKISSADKSGILKIRNAPVTEASLKLKTDSNDEEAKKIIRAVAQKELESFPTEMYTPELIDALSNDQYKDLLKSPNLTATRKEKIKEYRGAPIKEAFTGVTRVYDTRAGDYVKEKIKIEGAKKRIKGMGFKDVANLDTKVLTHPDMLAFYTPTYLKNLVRSGELRSDKIDAIREAFKREEIQIDTSLRGVAPVPKGPQQDQILETLAWLNDKGEGKGVDSF